MKEKNNLVLKLGGFQCVKVILNKDKNIEYY